MGNTLTTKKMLAEAEAEVDRANARRAFLQREARLEELRTLLLRIAGLLEQRWLSIDRNWVDSLLDYIVVQARTYPNAQERGAICSRLFDEDECDADDGDS